MKLNETTVKYLSGLLDSDGSITFHFSKHPRKDNDLFYPSLHVQLCSSDSVDRHGFIESLPDITGFGYSLRSGPERQYSYWVVVSRRDLEMLVPRITKHMCVKAKHLQRMFEKWREIRGVALSSAQCDELKSFSKASRADSGPLKPKNHPSFAWMSGYIDGNGCYYSKFRVRKNGNNSQVMNLEVVCHGNDAAILAFMQKAFGGAISPAGNGANAMRWRRNLGVKDRSFALGFLPKLVSHSRLKKHKIEQMIAFHHSQPQRLSERTPAGGTIV